ncbi:MAG TPA: glycosyl hydrolase family 39 [Puia sp.]|nr:glycosyl hydrolase family 39 [Puia sp.]
MKKGWLLLLLGVPGFCRGQKDSLTVDWDKTQGISKSVATLQVVVNPPLRRGSSIHDAAFTALEALGCDYVRYVPWLPYPRLAVAELQPPAGQKTSWDFSLIDPMTLDFLHATKGHPVILNFSTIPTWMYKTAKPIVLPESPDSVIWDYTQGTEPRDSTLGEIGDYYARLYSWYTKGGFTDELDKRHESGYHFDIPYWEVLNEVDFEHSNTPETYTKIYDAVVTAIRKVAPRTKFVGLALADPNHPEWFEYFLDPKHHKAGVPLDMISYHFYALGAVQQGLDVMQYTFFDRADGFLNVVRYIESIRKRLSPMTKTTVDEIGSILNSDFSTPSAPIPDGYWNLSGAVYAYVYLALTRMGIDVIGESQLVGYPTQFPSVSMINWKTGKPNARYWVLKLIKDNFGPGDVLVNTGISGDGLVAQAVNTSRGKRVLLINRTNQPILLALPLSFNGAKLTVVDPSTGDNEAASFSVGAQGIVLKPLAVGVIAL